MTDKTVPEINYKAVETTALEALDALARAREDALKMAEAIVNHRRKPISIFSDAFAIAMEILEPGHDWRKAAGDER